MTEIRLAIAVRVRQIFDGGHSAASRIGLQETPGYSGASDQQSTTCIKRCLIGSEIESAHHHGNTWGGRYIYLVLEYGALVCR